PTSHRGVLALKNPNPPPSSGPWFFDFGGPQTPVAAGCIGLSTVGYNSSRHFGWMNGNSVGWAGRKTVKALRRDIPWGQHGTFRVDLPTGIYNVTPVLGDPNAAHDQESIWLQGQQVASGLTTAAGQVLTPTYQVAVTNGQLAFRIADMGGVS